MPLHEHLDDSEETVHCTWCKRCKRKQRALYTYIRTKCDGQGDTGEAIGRDKSRRWYGNETAQQVDAGDEDCVSVRCLGDEEVKHATRRVRCLEEQPMDSLDGKFHRCCRETTGVNENCKSRPVEATNYVESSAAARTHTCHHPSVSRPQAVSSSPRHIVFETTCPCLCGYLKFKESIGACACQQHLRSHSLPVQKKEPVTNKMRDAMHWPSTSDVSCGSRNSLDPRTQKCCIPHSFSCFPCLRKRSKARCCLHAMDKNPSAAGEDKRQSKGSHQNDMKHTGTGGPQKDSWAEKRGRSSAMEEISNKGYQECCLCVLESRQSSFRKFHYGIKRMCGALFGCKQGKCLCECHRRDGERKPRETVKRVFEEREQIRQKIKESDPEEVHQSCGRGIATVKFDLLHFQEICSSEDARNADPDGELEHRIKFHSENTQETECICSQTEVPEVGVNIDETNKQNKVLHNAGTEKVKRNPQSVNRRVQFGLHRDCDCSCRAVDNTNYLVEHSDVEEACNIHPHSQGKAKQNVCICRKPKLQNLRKENLSEVSDNGEEEPNESELDALKKRKYHIPVAEISLRRPHETNQEDNPTLQGQAKLELLDGKTVKIEDKYFKLVGCGRTEPTSVSVSNAREQYGAASSTAKEKRAQRVEERSKKQVASNEEDPAYVTFRENGPFGDAPTLLFDKATHLRNHRKITEEPGCKKPVDTSHNTRVKIHTRNHSREKAKHPDLQDNNSDLPSSPPTPGTVLFLEGDRFVENFSSRESMLLEDSRPVSKARTEPPSETVESWNESKSEGDRKRTVSKASARTLELVEMSQRWLDGPVEAQSHDDVTPMERVWDIPVNNWLEEVQPFSCSEESEE